MKATSVFRPYFPPGDAAPGSILYCVVRQETCTVESLSDAKIHWPMCGSKLIVCGSLLKAIRSENSQEVADAWGVTVDQVEQWRNLLVAPAAPPNQRMTPGPASTGRAARSLPLHLSCAYFISGGMMTAAAAALAASRATSSRHPVRAIPDIPLRPITFTLSRG